jgi:hypothetical protein
VSTVVGSGGGEEAALFGDEGLQLGGEILDIAGLGRGGEDLFDGGKEVVEGADRGQGWT